MNRQPIFPASFQLSRSIIRLSEVFQMADVFNYRNAANFIFETGDLKRIRRSGWWHCKIRDPESVAEHSFRTSFIAYVIARLQKSDSPEKIAFLALIHDLPESRLLDLHRISGAYVGGKAHIEENIFRDQSGMLGLQLPAPSPSEAIIVKDADLLEMAFTAKEYADAGHAQATHLLKEAGRSLKLPPSKKLFSTLKSTPSDEWWLGLDKEISGKGTE